MKYTNKINISSQPHSYTLYYTKKDNHIYSPSQKKLYR